MSEAKQEPKSLNFFQKNLLLIIVITIIMIAALAVTAYFYLQNQKTQNLLKNPTVAAQVQTQQLLESVGKLMDLPKGEAPTIATVSDITKLQGQPFFANAKNGDKVLIYTTAKEAILYRPSENKIITVAPVNIGGQVTPSPTQSSKISPTPTKKPTPTQTK